MREAGNPSEARVSSAEISELANRNRHPEFGVPVSGYNMQAEITVPQASGTNMETVHTQSGVEPVFQPSEIPERPHFQAQERAGAAAVAQTVEEPERHLEFPMPPLQFQPSAVESAPEESRQEPSPYMRTPEKSNKEPNNPRSHVAEDIGQSNTEATETGDDYEPRRAYAPGQIRDAIRSAKAALDERGIDIREAVPEPYQRYVHELLGQGTNDEIAKQLLVADSTSVSRASRGIIKGLEAYASAYAEAHPEAPSIFPEGIFEPQGPVERPIEPNSFPDLFRQFREATGLTQSDVAEACGVSLATVVRLEKGLTHPPVVYVRDKLSKLGVDPDAVDTMIATYTTEREVARGQHAEKGEASPPHASSGRATSYNRDTIQLLHDSGTDLQQLIKNSNLRQNVKNNLLGALACGLLDDFTLSEVADKAATSPVTLNRHMSALLEHARTDEQYASIMPEPTARTVRPPYQGVGAQLSKARGDITIKEMSELLGLSRSALIRFQGGESFPDPSIAQAYTDELVRAGRITPDQAEQYVAGYAAEYAHVTAQIVAKRAE